MALALTIASVDRTSKLLAGSLSITDELGARNTCSFSLTLDGWSLEPGQPVVVQDGATKLFAGTVEQFEAERIGASPIQRVRVDCVDYNQLADRRIVIESYENQEAGAIVQDLVSKYLASDGVTAVVDGGPVIEKAVFNYVILSEALDELATLTTFKWNIDANKVLRFHDRTTYRAPWDVVEGADLRRVRYSRTRREYRNRQYVRGGRAKSALRHESFVGDGSQKVFNLQYPVATLFEVAVNGTVQTAGALGTPGAQWYYQVGDARIVQSDAEAPLGATDVLQVTYEGSFPVVAVAQDDIGIQDRRAVEGGTGLYEAIEYDEGLEKQESAEQKAWSYLDLYAKLPRILEFETGTPGLSAGQLLRVYLPFFGLDDDFLIQQVSISDVDGQRLIYRVRAVGSEMPGWLKWFKGLAKSTKRFVIRENEILLRVLRLPERVAVADTADSPHDARRPYTVGDSEVGYAEVSPMEYLWIGVGGCLAIG